MGDLVQRGREQALRVCRAHDLDFAAVDGLTDACLSAVAVGTIPERDLRMLLVARQQMRRRRPRPRRRH